MSTSTTNTQTHGDGPTPTFVSKVKFVNLNHGYSYRATIPWAPYCGPTYSTPPPTHPPPRGPRAKSASTLARLAKIEAAREARLKHKNEVFLASLRPVFGPPLPPPPPPRSPTTQAARCLRELWNRALALKTTPGRMVSSDWAFQVQCDISLVFWGPKFAELATPLFLAGTWAISAKERNRLAHALNGNTTNLINQGNLGALQGTGDVRDRSREQTIVGEVSLSPIPQLNGVVPVVSEYLFGASSPLIYYEPSTFPPEMTSSFGDFVSGDRLTYPNLPRLSAITYNRASHFMVHRSYRAATLPVPLSSRPDTILLTSPANRQSQPFSLAPQSRISKAGSVQFLPGFSHLEELWSPSYSYESLRSADASLSAFRFAGTRGNRIVAGYEARLNDRMAMFRELAVMDAQGQNYFSFFFSLLAMRYEACAFQQAHANSFPMDHPARVNPARLQLSNAVDPDDTNHLPGKIVLHHISAAVMPAIGPAGNPTGPEEDYTGTSPNPTYLRSLVSEGQAVFLDVEGMSMTDIRLAIRGFAGPSGHHQWRLPETAGGIVPSLQVPVSSSYFSASPTTSPFVTQFVLHWGQSAVPTDINHLLLGITSNSPVNASLSPWSLRPQSGAIDRLIRVMATRHHCWGDVERATEAVLYRGFWFCPQGNINPEHTSGLVSGFGDSVIRLPRIYTAPAYFDRFREPMAPYPSAGARVEQFLSLRPSQVIAHSYYMCLALACSLNWPATTYSASGAIWDAAANTAANVPQEIRNHATGLTGVFLSDQLTAWTTQHAAAMGIMYGFKPRNSTLATTSMKVDPMWHASRSPFIVHPYHELWMASTLPQHLVLPLPDEQVQWPSNEPRPAVSLGQVSPAVRVARALPPFTGRGWVQDGAMARSLNFYYSSFEEARLNQTNPANFALQFTVANWPTPFQQEIPTAPSTFVPPTFTFGNLTFLTPGSVQAYRVGSNRVLALGATVSNVTQTRDMDLIRDTSIINANWYDLSRGVENSGVGISYLPPTDIRVDASPVQDYSMLIWANRETLSYTGITVSSTSATHLSPPDAPAIPHYTAVNSISAPNWPSQLANHNPGPLFGQGGAGRARAQARSIRRPPADLPSGPIRQRLSVQRQHERHPTPPPPPHRSSSPPTTPPRRRANHTPRPGSTIQPELRQEPSAQPDRNRTPGGGFRPTNLPPPSTRSPSPIQFPSHSLPPQAVHRPVPRQPPQPSNRVIGPSYAPKNPNHVNDLPSRISSPLVSIAPGGVFHFAPEERYRPPPPRETDILFESSLPPPAPPVPSSFHHRRQQGVGYIPPPLPVPSSQRPLITSFEEAQAYELSPSEARRYTTLSDRDCRRLMTREERARRHGEGSSRNPPPPPPPNPPTLQAPAVVQPPPDDYHEHHNYRSIDEIVRNRNEPRRPPNGVETTDSQGVNAQGEFSNLVDRLHSSHLRAIPFGERSAADDASVWAQAAKASQEPKN
ncbi:structural protein [Caloscypha fulgens fusagravirus 1]|uniref:Structural protein n=1 Tax=Caloscypha fulgens fusagravirus 1 TaxID=2831243 RepID=A0AAE7REJ2_9VIRU|nr:structural protein [Caloscypha fulgens fusagravirus 1]